jgi:hypothetical protein
MDEPQTISRERMRTPRAAGVAGIAFSLLLGGALVLARLAVPAASDADTTWLTDEAKRRSVQVALGLVPFAGIAFLWFVGVIRDRIGELEDRFFATVFLESGLLFVAMLFVGAAIAGGMLTDPALGSAVTEDPGQWDLERRISFALINTYGIRMAAVFILSATTIGIRTRILPRWLVVTGLVAGLVLLFGTSVSTWANLMMPIWALLFSIDILVRNRLSERATET